MAMGCGRRRDFMQVGTTSALDAPGTDCVVAAPGSVLPLLEEQGFGFMLAVVF
jgi:hypothetical protein